MTGFYGQISRITVLPVTCDWLLRANLRNRRFARNGDLHFTGRFGKTRIFP
ncbi:hypothetical protein FC25_GL001132 [Ligilactobacillus ruminis DSM 20403 = NBRC 102161]|nr:hypothetical protein FC25_GL001132 [Ligilactobacillus ruminis DSM 20403 = NBRC 102161]